MAKIINAERRDIALPTGHVIPRLGELACTNDTIRCADNWPGLQGQMIAGQIVVEFDPEPEEPQPVKKGKTNG